MTFPDDSTEPKRIDHIPSHVSPPTDGIVYCTINRQHFRVPCRYYTGAAIRWWHEPPISGDRDLWLTVPGGPDEQYGVEDEFLFHQSGTRWFDTPRFINASSDSAEPLTGPYDGEAEPLSEDEIDEWIDNTDPPLLAMRFRATIDALTARVTELEGVLFTANEDKDEWRQSAEAWERSAEAWERSAEERLERAAAAEHRIEELTAERDEARTKFARERGAHIATKAHVHDLSAQVRIADDRLATAQHRYRGLETAARECVDAAKDLRKYVSPDSGCGYFTYKRIWDSSMQAETHFVHALAALSDKPHVCGCGLPLIAKGDWCTGGHSQKPPSAALSDKEETKGE